MSPVATSRPAADPAAAGWVDATARLVAARLGDGLKRTGRGAIASLSESAQALTALALRAGGRTVVWVGESSQALDIMAANVGTLAPPGDVDILVYPARETDPAAREQPNATITGQRLRTLAALAADRGPTLVATDVQALLQDTLHPDALAAASRTLAVGQDHDLAALSDWLLDQHYEFGSEVLDKGQAARRGGILDLWPPTADWPVRIDFFGATIDTIRSFDPTTQRSIERMDEAHVTPAREFPSSATAAESRDVFRAYVPDDAVVLWSDFARVQERAEEYERMSRELGDVSYDESFADVRAQIDAESSLWQIDCGSGGGAFGPPVDIGFEPAERLSRRDAELFEPDQVDATRRGYLDRLRELAGEGMQIAFFFQTEGSRDRFVEHYKGRGDEFFETVVGPLSAGFHCRELGLCVVAEDDLYGGGQAFRQHAARTAGRTPAQPTGSRLSAGVEIDPGDLVVHVDHGIGRYVGLEALPVRGREQECFVVEYADEARLYVPTAHAHLLSRYMSVGKSQARLHKLGGKRWDREKVAAEQAVEDLAVTLLETQATRESLQGIACAPDAPWQHEFEAAFPYAETVDQEVAAAATKRDMESTRPMDRLICGDVGYGKTEVAMRAVFKAVMGGAQVAVLVPTTVLAQQHFVTFSERMAAFPVRIAMLSRFRSKGEQDVTVDDLKSGAIDIVIGTHGLLQPRIAFKNLGLVVIDEEQRFGVRHKEQLKQLRNLVDVLTLTATPIPRTLYMSLTGAKDISTIQTPPRERRPVETIVSANTDEQVRDAIVRELRRDGQVFYLHHRVMSIARVRRRIEKLVPEARVIVGHGQMPARELSMVMKQFSRGDYDVLVCTTIIESGVDIPNANTILIDGANRFGVADLYQLRGRVGRAKRQAYAYLLLPPGGTIDDVARSRIGALQQHSALGSGFKLALRDLEIRGAGNLLGAAQSGHIAAVGFSLYCQLLKRTIARRKGEAPPPVIDVELKLDFIELTADPVHAASAAAIPASYIEDERLRIEAYRSIASGTSLDEVDSLRDEFRDRFGPIPPVADRLLTMTAIRIRAAGHDIRAVETQGEKLILAMGGDQYAMINGRLPRMKKTDADGKLKEIVDTLKRIDPETGRVREAGRLEAEG